MSDHLYRCKTCGAIVEQGQGARDHRCQTEVDELFRELVVLRERWRLEIRADMAVHLPAPAAQAHGRQMCLSDLAQVLEKYK